MKYMIPLCIFVSLFWATTSSAQTSPHKLFNGCEPIHLYWDSTLPDSNREFGYISTATKSLIEDRLLLFGMLSTESSKSQLRISIAMSETNFTLVMEFSKLHEQVGPLHRPRLITTWVAGKHGIYGRNHRFVLYEVSRMLDKFMLEFAIANEDACIKQGKDNHEQKQIAKAMNALQKYLKK